MKLSQIIPLRHYPVSSYLVSDDYGVYQGWKHGRQPCLAHLIRYAKGISERGDPKLSRPGAWILKKLRRLCRMKKKTPSIGACRTLHARLRRLVALYQTRKDDVGIFVRRLAREMEHLWTFLAHPGVEPTNNRAERLLRFAVLWRKRAYGTQNEKGNQLVERLLTLRHTCRLNNLPTFPILAEAISASFCNRPPDLSWINAAKV